MRVYIGNCFLIFRIVFAIILSNQALPQDYTANDLTPVGYDYASYHLIAYDGYVATDILAYKHPFSQA